MPTELIEVEFLVGFPSGASGLWGRSAASMFARWERYGNLQIASHWAVSAGD
jgi:hypothetical protein